MLGATRLHVTFGAVRPGFNEAGPNKLKAMLRGYSREGLSVMFVQSMGKAPMDPRTDAARKRMQKAWEEEGNTGEPPAGYHLATNDSRTLSSYVGEVRKRLDGVTARKNADGVVPPEVDAEYGLTPVNFGIVPDKSRVVVVDCDTYAETRAFRNWFADHTADRDLADNMDFVEPSVHTPGSVRGGKWNLVAEGFTYDEYNDGQKVWVPPLYENTGGDAFHAGGGHWYFFYPEGYELPEGTPAKIGVRYDSSDRSHLHDALRDAQAVHHAAEAALASFERPGSDPDDPDVVAAREAEEQARKAVEKARADLEVVQNAAREAYRRSQAQGANPEEVYQDLPTAEFFFMLRNSYVLVPPSSRYEGHYVIGSGDFPWEPWVEDLIEAHRRGEKAPDMSTRTTVPLVTPSPGASAADQYTDVEPFATFTANDPSTLNEDLEPWAKETSWESILVPHGFIPLDRPERCGCPTFTAPGPHSNPKSLVAHDEMCTFGEGMSARGVLHFWTDNIPEGFAEYRKRNFTKLNADAILNHGGSVGRALDAKGIKPRALKGLGDSIYATDFNKFLMDQVGVSENVGGLDATTPAEEVRKQLTFRDFAEIRDTPPPTPLISGALNENTFVAVIGKPGVGKSFLTIDMSAALATGTFWLGMRCRKRKVAYLAGEGVSGVIHRFKSWETLHGREGELDGNIFTLDDFPLLASFEPAHFTFLAESIVEHGIDVVVIDTWSRTIAGADENSAGEMSEVIGRLARVQRKTGCTVIVVHHTRKDGDEARGSTAFLGALDTEILVSEVEEDPDGLGRSLLRVTNTKQKDGAEMEERVCQILSQGEPVTRLDEENFPIITYPPVAIADLDGVYAPYDKSLINTTGNYFLDTTTSRRTYRDVPDRADILAAVLEYVESRPTTPPTMAETARSVTTILQDEDFNINTRLTDMAAREIIDTAIHRRLLRGTGSANKLSFHKPNAHRRDEIINDILRGDAEDTE